MSGREKIMEHIRKNSILCIVGGGALFILYRDAINETIIILKTQLPAIIKKRKKG